MGYSLLNEAFTGAEPCTFGGENSQTILLPFDLTSDLNNDGEINSSDELLESAAEKSGASDEEIEKGTEYLFANDDLSNGLWDVDDSDPDKPQGHTDDDDINAVKVVLQANFDDAWFEFNGTKPNGSGVLDMGDWELRFYKDKACTDEILWPLNMSTASENEDEIYVRAEGTVAQPVEGELSFVFGKFSESKEHGRDSIKFTVVRQLGDEKYFHAARDYMFENNKGKFVHNWGHPTNSPTTTIRLVSMLEETAFMQTIESFHKPNRSDLEGITEVMAAHEHLDVLINGNLVFFSHAPYNNPINQLLGLTEGEMTDLCNGRILEVGVNSPSSHDETPVVSGLNANLAGPNGRYVLQATDGKFTFAQGKVPTGGDSLHAIGGLHTDYNSFDASNWPIQMMGYGAALGPGQGVVFTATGLGLVGGKGKGPEFKAAAVASGVPPTPDGRAQLFFLDFGETSPALAHSNPDGDLNLIWKGTKHDGIRYYVNTYVGFIAAKPR